MVLFLSVRDESSNQSKTESETLRASLQTLRDKLLVLHKALVDSERTEYEKTIGKIPSPNHFLRLLTDDPWFAWLSPLSQLVVAMDAALDKKEPTTDAEIQALLNQAPQLLTVSEEGHGFPRHYFDALQRDPDVVLAHAEVAKLRPPPGGRPKK